MFGCVFKSQPNVRRSRRASLWVRTPVIKGPRLTGRGGCRGSEPPDCRPRGGCSHRPREHGRFFSAAWSLRRPDPGLRASPRPRGDPRVPHPKAGTQRHWETQRRPREGSGGRCARCPQGTAESTSGHCAPGTHPGSDPSVPPKRVWPRRCGGRPGLRRDEVAAEKTSVHADPKTPLGVRGAPGRDAGLETFAPELLTKVPVSLQLTSRASRKRTPISQRNTCTPSRRTFGAAPGRPWLPPPTASAPISAPKTQPLGRSLFTRSWTRAEGSGETRPVRSRQPVSHSSACCPCPALGPGPGRAGPAGPCAP